jgi:hypothetical protein
MHVLVLMLAALDSQTTTIVGVGGNLHRVCQCPGVAVILAGGHINGRRPVVFAKVLPDLRREDRFVLVVLFLGGTVFRFGRGSCVHRGPSKGVRGWLFSADSVPQAQRAVVRKQRIGSGY